MNESFNSMWVVVMTSLPGLVTCGMVDMLRLADI